MKLFNLKNFRASKKMTLKDMSLKTGIPQPYIAEIEKGLRPLSSENKKKITEAFKEDELFGFSDN